MNGVTHNLTGYTARDLVFCILHFTLQCRDLPPIQTVPRIGCQTSGCYYGDNCEKKKSIPPNVQLSTDTSLRTFRCTVSVLMTLLHTYSHLWRTQIPSISHYLCMVFVNTTFGDWNGAAPCLLLRGFVSSALRCFWGINHRTKCYTHSCVSLSKTEGYLNCADLSF
jgi:hypothetical protein